MRNNRFAAGITAFIMAIGLVVPNCTSSAGSVELSELQTSAGAAVVYDCISDRTVYEKNADAVLPMASTTKIMTAIVVIESCDISKEILVSPEAVDIEGSSIYLTAGEKISIETLLYALLLESANDAAAALAYEVSGSVEEFAELMNKKAESLGLKNTHYTNPHGLDEEGHYTTARELACLADYALDNETFAGIVSTKKKVTETQDGTATRYMVNHNRLLNEYDGCIGVKTGYTKSCGRCLVSAAERNGMRFVAVTLSDPNDWRDHKNMFDSAFASYNFSLLCPDGGFTYDVPTVNGSTEKITCISKGTATLVSANPSPIIDVRVEVPQFCWAPVEKGEIVGYVCYYADGVMVQRLPLCAESGCKETKYKTNIFVRFTDWITGWFR